MLSVILPVRNGGEHFRRCIRSIARQDAAPGAFDVVVLDNQSTDGGLDALRELPDTIPRRVLPAPRALSIEDNWRRIVELTDVRPFITVVGHDDELDPEFVRVATTGLATSPELCLSFSHFRLIDANGDVIRACLPMAASETAGEFLAGRLTHIRDSFGTGYVIRFAAFRRAGGFPPYPDLIFADDALIVALAQRAPMRILGEQTFSYRLHASSTSHSQDADTFRRALAAYTAFLEQTAPGDAGVRRALDRYGAGFIRRTANSWMENELLHASAADRPARREVLDGWRQLAERFSLLVGQPLGPLADSPQYRFHEWTNQSGLRRRLSRHEHGQRLLRLAHRIRRGAVGGSGD